MPYGEERGTAFDHALEREREERETSGAERLEESQAAFAHDVDEREPQQPVHPPLEMGGFRRSAGRERSGGGGIRHRDILGAPSCPEGCGRNGAGVPPVCR